MTKSIAACVAGLAVAAAVQSASAAVISATLSLPIAAGAGLGGLTAPSGVGSLAYAYDDSFLASGSGTADIAHGLSKFTLTFGTLSLNGMSTIDAPVSPALTFVGGTLISAFANFTQDLFFFSTPTYNVLGASGNLLASGTPVAVTIVPGSLVPEPATLALIGLGLATLTATRRRG